jgi:hypothetical protein
MKRDARAGPYAVFKGCGISDTGCGIRDAGMRDAGGGMRD